MKEWEDLKTRLISLLSKANEIENECQGKIPNDVYNSFLIEVLESLYDIKGLPSDKK